MRTRELQPNTRYATESGICVETAETVERGWYAWRANYNGPMTVQKGPPAMKANDPWSKRKPLVLADGTRPDTGPFEGVRVTVHPVDNDGEPVKGASLETVIDPRLIAGTWAKYMELHGEKVRSEAMSRAAQAAATEKSKELAAAADKAGLEVTRLWVRPQYVVRGKDGTTSEAFHAPRGTAVVSWHLVPQMEVEGAAVQAVIEAWAERAR